MSADPPSSPTANGKSRHWITDIQVTPENSDPNCKFSARLFVDNELVCNLPSIDSTRPLRWSGLLSCDVSPASTVALRLCRSVNGRSRYFNFPPVTISEVDEETGEATLELAKAAWVVTIKSLTPAITKQLFPDELERFDAIEGVYDSLQSEETMKYLFKHALRFASTVAKVLPESTAMVSFHIYMKAWDLLDQQSQLDNTVQTILQGLTCIRNIVDIVSQASDSMLAVAMSQSKEVVDRTLALLEDVCMYIFNRYTTNDLARILPEEEEENDTYEPGLYLVRLEELQKAFYSSWSPTAVPRDSAHEASDECSDTSQQHHARAVHGEPTKTDWYEVVTLLKPINPSGYNSDYACMDGTREALLTRIITWTQNRDSLETLMWISGQAGMGKTAIATSICRRLYNTQTLAGSFFCRRDSPNFNDSLALINNLICELAMKCPAYAHEVSAAIMENPTLCSTYVSSRYEGLVRGPLQKLKHLSMPKTLVVVVDGLDECGNEAARVTTLDKLYEMSTLIPWLKVIITGRPVADMQQFFQANRPNTTVTHLQDYDASPDIRTYIEAQVAQLAEKERWPSDAINQLCSMSSGVFLWAKLAVTYIKKSAFPALPRLRKILNNQKSPVTDYFDSLYTNSLAVAIGDHEDEIKDACIRCIGAILAISEREPLAVPDLQYLLIVAGRMDQLTLEQTLINLGPLLLVIDGRRIRFYHPSFKQFITDPSRSGPYHIQLDRFEADPAACCLRIMQQDLRFNICQLETSHRRNSEVPDLKSRIDSHIGPALKYACTHWIDHFIASPHQQVAEAIKQFMEGPQLMFWIEVLSLLGRVDIATVGIKNLTTLKLNNISGWDVVASWAKDVHRFIVSFYDPITASTPHLYVSALAFTPQRSPTAMRMRPYFPNLISVAQAGDLYWHPCIKATVHPYAVQTLSISPDGGRIVVGYPDGSLAIWDLQSGACVSKSSVGHRDMATCVSFSPDGTTIASSSHDNTLRVWDVSRDLQRFSVLSGHSGPVHSIAFSPDGSLIASGSSDKTIRLWNVSTLNQIPGARVGHSSRITSVAFSPDGKRLVSGSWDQTIRVWSVDVRGSRLSDTPLVITGHSDSVTCVVFSPDGSRITSGSVDKTIRMWDSRTGEKSEQHSLSAKHLDTVNSLAFSPDGKCIASCSLDGKIQPWDAASLNAYSPPLGHCAPVNVIAFSFDGRHIVSGSTDMTTRIWEIDAYPKPIPTIEPISTKTLVGHSGYVLSIAITSNGTRIVSGSGDKTVRIWDAQTGAPVGDPLTGHSSYVYSVAVSPDGGRFVSASNDKSMKLWDIATRVNINSYQHGSPIYCAAFSPYGTKIAFGGDDNKVYLWNVKGWQMIKDGLQGHSGTVLSLAFSPDGTYLASASADNTVILWDVESHSRAGSPLSGHTSCVRSIAFSPCGTQIVSGSEDSTIRVWDIQSGSTVHTLTGHTSYVFAAAFSPDGSCIASGSGDGALRLWNVKTGQPIGQPFTGHSDYVRSVIFSPDGNYLISGADDQTIRVWDISKSYLASEPETPPPDGFSWPASPYELKSHPDHPGWVSHDQKSHMFWLPAHYERHEMFPDLGRNPSYPVCLNYSKFVHGTEWTKTACDSIQNRSE